MESSHLDCQVMLSQFSRQCVDDAVVFIAIPRHQSLDLEGRSIKVELLIEPLAFPFANSEVSWNLLQFLFRLTPPKPKTLKPLSEYIHLLKKSLREIERILCVISGDGSTQGMRTSIPQEA